LDYYQYTLHTTAPEHAEMLIAFLADAPFDTFEETETGVEAYLPARANATEEAEALLTELAEQFDFEWVKTFIPGQNWNEIWESNFHPVIVGDLCAVRADFHDPIPNVRFEMIINPKMAFGTGHHETTWMCLHKLESLPLQGKKILDYGCGTGILAILASKLGATELEAVDIESESYLNTLDNCTLNDVSNVTARLGTLDDVQGRAFDGILANINKHIILDSLPRLATLLVPGGWLLISGILLQDEAVVCAAAEAAGFVRKSLDARGNWLCIHFEHQQG
jgi:ribosomal protein L11 methyltransferase